jgi:hypothetical protein
MEAVRDKELHEAQNLLEYTAVFLIACQPTFQRCVLPASSGHGSTSQKILSFILAAVRT